MGLQSRDEHSCQHVEWHRTIEETAYGLAGAQRLVDVHWLSGSSGGSINEIRVVARCPFMMGSLILGHLGRGGGSTWPLSALIRPFKSATVTVRAE